MRPRRDNLKNFVQDQDETKSLGTFSLKTKTLTNQRIELGNSYAARYFLGTNNFSIKNSFKPWTSSKTQNKSFQTTLEISKS